MTEATLHYVCEGAVVLYKRDGSNTECWYARQLSTTQRCIEQDGEAQRKVTAMLYE